MQQGHVLALTTVDAAKDDEAFALAAQIFQACDDICDAYEIWQGHLWLKTGGISLSAAANNKKNRLADMEDPHQTVIVEREIELQDSYAAIRKTRKLLETVKVLSPLFGRLH